MILLLDVTYYGGLSSQLSNTKIVQLLTLNIGMRQYGSILPIRQKVPRTRREQVVLQGFSIL